MKCKCENCGNAVDIKGCVVRTTYSGRGAANNYGIFNHEKRDEIRCPHCKSKIIAVYDALDNLKYCTNSLIKSKNIGIKY